MTVEAEHASPDVEVVALLSGALAAVRAADLPAELEGVAYGKAIELLAHRSEGATTQEASGRHVPGSTAGDDAADDVLHRVARRFHIEDARRLVYVFEFGDDEVDIVVQRSRFPKDKANAAREVCLLYAAARQAGRLDETATGYSKLREKANDMGVYDSKNFSTTLAGMRDWFAIKGSGQKREFKVTQHGFEEAGKLVMKLVGEPN